MSDPDTSTKELRETIELIIKSHFEDYEWPSPSGGVSSATLCAEQILEALQSAKKDCISKEEVERAINTQEKLNFMLHGRPDCKSCSMAETLRDNLGLDDKS